MSIAKDYETGRCCSECGRYFSEENGFPALCSSCWCEAVTNDNLLRLAVDQAGRQKSIYPLLWEAEK